ncbi:MAG: type II toxin-antitoxin system RelE/ParE family toxin [Bacteroidetes bacterium]|nr:type II toxin-antitoxin system RelE/ParE family toxin [Bacteroidota bacterium]MCK4406588.1 type II toxin-antitoxin system RelE/ParE family toxin [Bacteroidales bacterium]MCK4639579.1 type II toxin-antitoxin system RelE/ParE family toxin [Bacteroidales bacterium]
MVKIIWTDQAIEDINNIAEFIAKDSEKYAKIQVERFFDRTETLINYPQSGRIVPEINNQAIRELIIGNYRIIYKIISQKRIDIITVHHSRRLLSSNMII